MINIAQLAGVALVFMRMTGCILFNPLLGGKNFPSIFKAGLIIMLTLVIASFAQPETVDNINSITLLILMIKEFIVGYTIGFICTLFTYIIVFGGELMDMQMGISMSKIYDPQSNVSMSLSATFFNITYMFLFFTTDAHLNLIKLFLTSGEVIPYGELQIHTELTGQIIDVFCQCTVLAIKLAMPILATQFLMEIGVGILMKAIPQINVFVVNIQAKLFIGLLVLVFVFSPVVSFLGKSIELMFDAINASMYLLK
ncbi:MAG: flagellar biosynthetic protein FliR [Anaerovorax sp.]|nr:flagellar biosynthetic protein FliR [Anaerovorax sp.]